MLNVTAVLVQDTFGKLFFQILFSYVCFDGKNDTLLQVWHLLTYHHITSCRSGASCLKGFKVDANHR